MSVMIQRWCHIFNKTGQLCACLRPLMSRVASVRTSVHKWGLTQSPSHDCGHIRGHVLGTPWTVGASGLHAFWAQPIAYSNDSIMRLPCGMMMSLL